MSSRFLKSVLATPLLLALVALTLASCATSAKFDYAHAEGLMFRASADHIPMPPVSVLPFQDCRGPRTSDGTTEEQVALLTNRGDFRLGWIPLMPYAWEGRQFPEVNGASLATLRNFWCSFDRELAEATVTSIQHSGLFREVRFAESAEQVETRYVITGILFSTEYQAERLTYGVTYLAAPILWCVGFPTAVSHDSLVFSLQLTDRETNQVLWKYRYDGSESIPHFLYYGIGEDASGYARLMKQAMNAALYDLDRRVQEARK